MDTSREISTASGVVITYIIRQMYHYMRNVGMK